MPWFDLDEAFFDGTLPPGLREAQERFRGSNHDVSGIDVCRDLAQARAFLYSMNSVIKRNELIGLESTLLGAVKGTIERETDLTWLGYDVWALGNGSLLREGPFTVPEKFSPWLGRINGSGLFDGPDVLDGFVESYKQTIEEGVLEELPSPRIGIDTIRVGRVQPTPETP
jgi:hypothetical protein